MDRAFSKGTPSVFFVGSPFQALCAIAAIRQFHILDYEFYAEMFDNNPRNKQLETLLDQFEVNYRAIQIKGGLKNILLDWSKALKPRKKGYQRLFVGDVRNIPGILRGIQLVSNNADILYLDDGSFTVSVLENTYKPKGILYKIINKSISILRNIDARKKLLTIYDDIPNGSYVVHGLKLSGLLENGLKEKSQIKNVIIVGTNSSAYCECLNIAPMIFYSCFENLLVCLKHDYPDDGIIFIPHGRDNSEEIKSICLRQKVSYKLSKTMIELELLNYNYCPKAVYGYTSTALLTIKKIFKTDVYNLMLQADEDNDYYRRYLECSSYYEKHGIQTCYLKNR